MRLEGLGFPAVVLASILKPDLHELVDAVHGEKKGFLESSLGITHLDLFLAERDAVHDICPRYLVWFWVSLILEFKNCVVLGAINK